MRLIYFFFGFCWIGIIFIWWRWLLIIGELFLCVLLFVVIFCWLVFGIGFSCVIGMLMVNIWSFLGSWILICFSVILWFGIFCYIFVDIFFNLVVLYSLIYFFSCGLWCLGWRSINYFLYSICVRVCYVLFFCVRILYLW